MIFVVFEIFVCCKRKSNEKTNYLIKSLFLLLEITIFLLEVIMRVQINNEIRDYSESIFFGLNLRQLIFSALACGVAVGSYFLFRKHMGIETLSWLCILCASPFAALGFFKYNGMTAEKVLWCFIKSEILMPYQLSYHATNHYENLLKESDKEQSKNKKRKRGNRNECNNKSIQ
jgi:hypothetical protein